MLIFNKQISTARDLIFKFTYYSVVAAAGIDVAVRLQLPDAWYFDTFDTVQSVTATSFFAFFAFVCQNARIKNYTLFFSSFFSISFFGLLKNRGGWMMMMLSLPSTLQPYYTE